MTASCLTPRNPPPGPCFCSALLCYTLPRPPCACNTTRAYVRTCKMRLSFIHPPIHPSPPPPARAGQDKVPTHGARRDEAKEGGERGGAHLLFSSGFPSSLYCTHSVSVSINAEFVSASVSYGRPGRVLLPYSCLLWVLDFYFYV